MTSSQQPPKHSVSVAAAIIDDQGRFLAIRRADNGRWEPPGGVLELHESIEEGLIREVAEETGLTIEPLALTGVYKNMQPRHRRARLPLRRCQRPGPNKQRSARDRMARARPAQHPHERRLPHSARSTRSAMGPPRLFAHTTAPLSSHRPPLPALMRRPTARARVLKLHCALRSSRPRVARCPERRDPLPSSRSGSLDPRRCPSSGASVRMPQRRRPHPRGIETPSRSVSTR